MIRLLCVFALWVYVWRWWKSPNMETLFSLVLPVLWLLSLLSVPLLCVFSIQSNPINIASTVMVLAFYYNAAIKNVYAVIMSFIDDRHKQKAPETHPGSNSQARPNQSKQPNRQTSSLSPSPFLSLSLSLCLCLSEWSPNNGMAWNGKGKKRRDYIRIFLYFLIKGMLGGLVIPRLRISITNNSAYEKQCLRSMNV